ncbi:hypothetical protein [Campylobacter coli]|uniref:hypothetical protein n=1 Tax=Campylobacter coli TaxID=195 RepID=UPI000AA623D2|nr:hypothetical protein [Campylobacter coli]
MQPKSIILFFYGYILFFRRQILLSVATFAYDPYTCSLQNLINPGSCNPNLVPNDEYAC